jgi:hypothetical protein
LLPRIQLSWPVANDVYGELAGRPVASQYSIEENAAPSA